MGRIKAAVVGGVRCVLASVYFLCLCLSAGAFIAIVTLNELLEIKP